MSIERLEPKALWKHFVALSRIPRGSKNEAAAAAYVREVARRRGLEVRQDAAGNVVVRKPAAGRGSAPSVCLQGHLDMVCEKNRDKVHDFTRDPIELVQEGAFVRANATTLGADNGIGVAAALALLEDDSCEHGPLELLFTVDEESGLTGAARIGGDFLESRVLLNLDSEEEGTLYIGCAGGKNTVGTFAVAREPAPAGTVAFEISVRGLRGGHSGLDIDKGRGNAIKILSRVLARVSALGGRLAHLQGGNKRNAIARESQAVVLVPAGAVEAVETATAEVTAAVKAELAAVEPGLAIELVRRADSPETVLDEGQQRRLLLCLTALPHGILRMSTELAGLVETSTNLGVVETHADEIVITTSQRSAVASANLETTAVVSACFALAGARVEVGAGYPGWKPDLSSRVLGVAKSAHLALFGREPAVKAIHAGLECGLIGEKFPGMDMVSFGPAIEGAHSPVERVHIESVARFWALLREVLRRLR